jgi:hypothetical protein
MIGAFGHQGESCLSQKSILDKIKFLTAYFFLRILAAATSLASLLKKGSSHLSRILAEERQPPPLSHPCRRNAAGAVSFPFSRHLS